MEQAYALFATDLRIEIGELYDVDSIDMDDVGGALLRVRKSVRHSLHTKATGKKAPSITVGWAASLFAQMAT